jgi:hypothetical protein
MITTSVSFRVATGKNAEALEYLQSIVRQAKKLSGAELRILTRLGGPIGQYVITGQYEDLNAWNAARSKLTLDPTFQKLQAGAATAGLFVPGTTESALFEHV